VAPPDVQQLLQRISARRDGRLFLANLLETLGEELLPASTLRALLTDLAREAAAFPNDRFPDQLVRVCRGAAGSGEGYLRATKPPASGFAGPVAHEWTTLVSATAWTKWHCDRHQPSVRSLGAFPPGPDVDFASRFEELIADGDWTFSGDVATGRPAATMGPPREPGFAKGPHCWVSCETFDPDLPVAPSSLNGSARRVHESVGLEPTANSPFDSWLRYRIDARAVRQELGFAPARPSATDLGNRWFRVKGESVRAATYAGAGWGCTVNLTVVRARRGGDAGRPEQVVASIPVSAPFLKGVQWLPLAERDRRRVRYPLNRFRQGRPFGLRPGPLRQAVENLLWP
jgi:hypothetical protein